MNDYELISDADYATLPDDPEGQFLALESICRRKISKLMTQESSSGYDFMVRLQYMSTVAAAAEELGFSGLSDYRENRDTLEAFNEFLLSANVLVTKLRLRKAGRNSQNSVQLSQAGRARIALAVSKLKRLIEKSELPHDRKISLTRNWMNSLKS